MHLDARCSIGLVLKPGFFVPSEQPSAFFFCARVLLAICGTWAWPVFGALADFAAVGECDLSTATQRACNALIALYSMHGVECAIHCAAYKYAELARARVLTTHFRCAAQCSKAAAGVA